jgi:hypothetical protein
VASFLSTHLKTKEKRIACLFRFGDVIHESDRALRASRAESGSVSPRSRRGARSPAASERIFAEGEITGLTAFSYSKDRKNPICNADGIFSVKFVPYGTSEIRWRV